MNMLGQNLIRLSQSHLNLLSLCPPKFQQIYLDCLGTIPDLRRQENMKWGSQFHLLMQQRELTLPIEPLLESDRELETTFKALIENAAELGINNSDIWREAEHCRTFAQNNFVLTVIYDLLIAKTDRAIILDWKTYRQPQKATKLAHNWQTRLYLYILAETSEYSPEQIEMTYWFVKPDRPTSVTFQYSELQHRQTEQDLLHLLTKLETWLHDYQERQIDFPHLPDCEAKCPYYQFFSSQTYATKQPQEWLESIEQIDEISI